MAQVGLDWSFARNGRVERAGQRALGSWRACARPRGPGTRVVDFNGGEEERGWLSRKCILGGGSWCGERTEAGSMSEERGVCGKVRIVIADVGAIAAEADIRILACRIEWGMEGGVYAVRDGRG